MYEEIIKDLRELTLGKSKYCIAVDGKCGSGKSTFSELLAKELDADLVHIDHFYLPFKDRVPNWKEVPAGNMDFDRLESTVLIPYLSGEKISYYRFNQFEQKPAEEYQLSGKDIMILDGSYSMHPRISKYFDYCIFMTCSEEIQDERLQKREIERYDMFKSIWIKMELNYHKKCNVVNRADIVIDTTNSF